MNQIKNIFVVEDDISVRNLIDTLLEEQKYNVIASVKNKVNFCKKIEEFHEKIDLILLDIELMNGSDGINCLLEMYKKGFCKDIPVLFMTGRSDEETLNRISKIETGAGLIIKPFHEQEFLSKIKLIFLKNENANANETHVHHSEIVKILGGVIEENDSNLESILFTFGNEVRKKRKDKRLTQSQLADSLSINYRHFQDLEAGKVNLRMETFLKLVNFLNDTQVA